MILLSAQRVEHWDLPSLQALQAVPAWEWVLGIRGLVLKIWLCVLQLGNMKCSPLDSSRINFRLDISRDSKSIPIEPAHHFSSKPDCNNCAVVPSFTLRTALSAMPFVSERWGFQVRWFQDKTSHAFPNSIELSVYSSVRSVRRLQEFWHTFLRFVWRFCFIRIRLNPLSGKILYHDSVLVIVSGFTSFNEDFVVGRYQVTKLFCTRPVRLLEGAFAFLVLKQTSQFRSFGKWVKILCFRDFDATSTGSSGSDSREPGFFELRQPLRKICQRIVFILVIPLFFGCGFLGMLKVLSLKMNSKQLCFQRLVMLLFSTSPVIAM